jgi:hypothetical protein
MTIFLPLKTSNSNENPRTGMKKPPLLSWAVKLETFKGPVETQSCPRHILTRLQVGEERGCKISLEREKIGYWLCFWSKLASEVTNDKNWGLQWWLGERSHNQQHNLLCQDEA